MLQRGRVMLGKSTWLCVWELSMKTRLLRNSTKRLLVYVSVFLLYLIVFSNFLLATPTEAASMHLPSVVDTGGGPAGVQQKNDL